jgi:hypothetical protein
MSLIDLSLCASYVRVEVMLRSSQITPSRAHRPTCYLEYDIMERERNPEPFTRFSYRSLLHRATIMALDERFCSDLF